MLSRKMCLEKQGVYFPSITFTTVSPNIYVVAKGIFTHSISVPIMPRSNHDNRSEQVILPGYPPGGTLNAGFSRQSGNIIEQSRQLQFGVRKNPRDRAETWFLTTNRMCHRVNTLFRGRSEDKKLPVVAFPCFLASISTAFLSQT